MSDSRAEDEAAIQAVLAESYKAWAAGDADGMVADYTEDATAIMPGGLRDSRDVIRKGMVEGFASFLKDTSTVNKQLSIRFLADDAAIVITEAGRGQGELHLGHGEAGRPVADRRLPQQPGADGRIVSRGCAERGESRDVRRRVGR